MINIPQEAIEIDKFFFFEIIAIPLAVFVVAYYTWKPVTRFMMKIIRSLTGNK